MLHAYSMHTACPYIMHTTLYSMLFNRTVPPCLYELATRLQAKGIKAIPKQAILIRANARAMARGKEHA